MNSCLGIEGLGSSSICIHPSIIGSLGTSLCQVKVRRPFLTTFGGMFLGCCVGGRPFNLVRLPRNFSFLVYWLLWSSFLTLCVFLFYSQRLSRVGEQVWRAYLGSRQVCEHHWRFWRAGWPSELSSSLFGTRAFPLHPSCHPLGRKKWVTLGRK